MSYSGWHEYDDTPATGSLVDMDEQSAPLPVKLPCQICGEPTTLRDPDGKPLCAKVECNIYETNTPAPVCEKCGEVDCPGCPTFDFRLTSDNMGCLFVEGQEGSGESFAGVFQCTAADPLGAKAAAEIANRWNAYADLLAACKDALVLYHQGDFSNGCTDGTGTIDEGRVRAGEIYEKILLAIRRVDPDYMPGQQPAPPPGFRAGDFDMFEHCQPPEPK